MKKIPGIRPWIKKQKPDILPPINITFETKEISKPFTGNNILNHEIKTRAVSIVFTDNALLYQGILRHAKDYSNYYDGFSFTEMGNWLIKTLPEFVNFYTDSKAKIPYSARLENRRDRIEEHIHHLINMELLSIKRFIPSRKNPRESIPVFSLTMEGTFLSYLIEARDVNKSSNNLNWMLKSRFEQDENDGNKESISISIDQERRSKAIREVFEIVHSYVHFKESYVLRFLDIFFRKCFNNNLFVDLIDIFYYVYLRFIKVNKGQELLRLFTKINYPLQWIFVHPDLFMETLDEIDEETKKLILFKFKMEIEEYYDLYYLVSHPRRHAYSELHSDDSYYEHNMAISGIEWQSLRFNNIHNHLVVTIPGLCLKCKSEQPFIMDINDYLNNFKEFSNESLDRENIISVCPNCKTNSVIGKIYMPLDMVRGHEMI
jgi:hypothetical protein